MHIPDGYLSPATCAATYAVSAAFAAYASKKVAKELDEKKIPLIAVASAFSFVIMMFNIPIPGGTTGHAVGGSLIAILLGPWAAMLAVSLALIVQALLFGDGGVTTFGANVLTMGVIMPFVGYSFYRLISGDGTSMKRKLAGSFIGSYMGINVAALAASVLLGIQPYIARDPRGLPLYSPFPLKVTVPVMTLQHIFFFGFVEGFITLLVLKYLLSMNFQTDVQPWMSRKLGLGVACLALISPLGLIIPAYCKAGGAWGEGGGGGFWKAPFPDYAVPFGPNSGLAWQSFWYAVCGLLGVLFIYGVLTAARAVKQKSDG